MLTQVPLIYKIKLGAPLLLAHPYPCIVDPTRRMSNCQRLENRRDIACSSVLTLRSSGSISSREKRLRCIISALCVQVPAALPPASWMTLIYAADMSSKMKNVSNRDNHDGSLQFLRDFQVWTPEVGVIHPHPWGRKVFKVLLPPRQDFPHASSTVRVEGPEPVQS
eukprot:758003-Hanusia_phi.AAC.3